MEVLIITDKEKLVELLLEVDSVCEAGDCCECVEEACYTHRAADHLIANGVTFATDSNVGDKWIPVTERLPEKSGYYLYKAKDPHRGLCDGIGLSYFMHRVKDWKKVYSPYVTHWMPLPKFPKEM